MLADQGSQPPPPAKSRSCNPAMRAFMTKPLGSGILLAAGIAGAGEADLMGPARGNDATQQSTGGRADRCVRYPRRYRRDWLWPGRAFAGMLHSRVGAELELANIPLLPGVAELVAQGVRSTLEPRTGGRRNSSRQRGCRQSPVYTALFDPQTCGGLLFGVPQGTLNALLERLRFLCDAACVIGRVVAGPPICAVKVGKPC